MSTHAYSRLWTHLIWETLDREPMLDKRAAAKASSFRSEYSLGGSLASNVKLLRNWIRKQGP
jgi:hypothetical protein